MPNVFKILPKWQNFEKSGHTGCKGVTRTYVMWRSPNTQKAKSRNELGAKIIRLSSSSVTRLGQNIAQVAKFEKPLTIY